MAKTKSVEVAIAYESVMNQIYVIRDQKVTLDRDLAGLYGVTTGNLNKVVNRNIKRFPDDFMFQLTLNSDRAIAVNIQIMRVFTRIRQMLTDNSELRLEIADIKQAVEGIDGKL